MSKKALKKAAIVLLVVLAVCAAAATVIFVSRSNGLRYAYMLTVRSGGGVQVHVRVSNNSFAKPQIRLGKVYFAANDLSCSDGEGNPVPIADGGDHLVIESAYAGGYVDVVYEVSLPRYTGENGSVVTASGEQFLLFPYFSYEQGEHKAIAESVEAITIAANPSDGGGCILPFMTEEGQFEISVKRPKWKDIYDLQKSCYAIGDIERIPGGAGPSSIPVYTVGGYAPDEQVMSITGGLISYYNGLFGAVPEGLPLLLLPQTEKNFEAVIGGRGVAVTVPRTDKDALFSFAQGLFTAYFDNKVRADSLHYPPNLWFYKGIATYYAAMAADHFPDDIREALHLGSERRFDEFYRRYLYIWMKEPAVYRITPADEADAMDAQRQFFFYTTAPLVIKHMEMTANELSARTDAVLGTLLEDAENETFDMADYMYKLLGDRQEEIYNYLSAGAAMPYPGASMATEIPSEVVAELDSFERLLCSWMQLEFPQYLYESVSMMDAEVLADECIRLDVHFGSDAEEVLAATYSPTVFLLLKQYALRAKICGFDDLSEPTLRFSLLYEEENEEKWDRYLASLFDGDGA